jgi:hypothetical protein
MSKLHDLLGRILSNIIASGRDPAHREARGEPGTGAGDSRDGSRPTCGDRRSRR